MVGRRQRERGQFDWHRRWRPWNGRLPDGHRRQRHGRHRHGRRARSCRRGRHEGHRRLPRHRRRQGRRFGNRRRLCHRWRGRRRWHPVQGRRQFALRGPEEARRLLVLQLGTDRRQQRSLRQHRRAVRADGLGALRQRAERLGDHQRRLLVRQQGLRLRARLQRARQQQPGQHPGRDGGLACGRRSTTAPSRSARRRRRRTPPDRPGSPASWAR